MKTKLLLERAGEFDNKDDWDLYLFCMDYDHYVGEVIDFDNDEYAIDQMLEVSFGV